VSQRLIGYHPLQRVLFCCLLLALLIAPLQQPLPARAQAPEQGTAPASPLAPPESPAPAAAPASTPATTPRATVADDPLTLEVEALLASMEPADRVGQLFIVTFEGNEISAESDITQLLVSMRVGGVAISPQNLNFSNEKGVDTPRQVATLANQLQGVAYGILLPPERVFDPLPIAPWPPEEYSKVAEEYGFRPSNIPLLIAVEQPGDGLPSSALRRGFMPLPSQMALGATWNLDLARSVGEVVGRELRAVGANMLLGPSLDVFDLSNVDAIGRLGVYSFGSSPYWVSQLGQAYIAGVHAGGDNQVATVTRHFPGQGSSDRPPQDEVATIQKSLEGMRTSDLVPFVATTRGPSSVVAEGGDPSSTDVMMTSHMRFSAFQGGAAGRITPISLAPELRTALTQEGFDTWRNTGGVVMSDALGVPAIRRFYGADAQNFFSPRVALDAFLAGHDLIYLANFSLDDTWESERANIIETVGFFGDRYREDADFASRVDQSVRRILRLKLGLYRNALIPAAERQPTKIPLPTILVGESSLNVLSGEPRTAAEGVMNEVARQALTILYPDPDTQTEPLPPTFRTDDNILIFSDSRLLRECSTCTAEAAIGPDALADIIKQLYGSEATGQIDPARITSLTFAELTAFMDYRTQAPPVALDVSAPISPAVQVTGPVAAQAASSTTTSVAAGAVITSSSGPTLTQTVTPPVITAPDLEDQPVADTDALVQERIANTERLIEDADWVLFAMLDVSTEQYPASGAVTRFLREYGDELTDQRLVVFALNAPYFLDATEMSRLTTYFGVYSKTQPFLENAVRGLFRAFAIMGAPPVSVPGTRFASLNDRLAPNPAELIPLQVTAEAGDLLAANASALGGLNLEAGTAIDTPPIDVGATLGMVVGPIVDRNGHNVPDGTLVEFDLKYDGEELAMALDPAVTRGGVATRNVVVERPGTLRVAAAAGGAVTGDPLLLIVVPPPTPTPEPAPANAQDGAVLPGGQPALPQRMNLLTLVIALFTIVVTLSLFLIVQVRVLPRAALVHNMLWAAIFGLLGYLMYGLGLLPGANWLRANISVWGTTVVVFVPMLLPLLWLQLRGEE
jgi:beta-N-acetylhexosaminidase